VAHQARNNNLGDVTAKDGSQETAVNLIGMLLGLLVMPHLDGEQQGTNTSDCINSERVSE